jgi:hypothetical protein
MPEKKVVQSKKPAPPVVDELRRAREIKCETTKDHKIRAILLRIVEEIGHRYPVAFSIVVRTVLSEKEREQFSKLLKELGMTELRDLLKKSKEAA